MAQDSFRIDEALKIVLDKYRDARTDSFSRHPIADFIRQDLADIIKRIIGENERYIVEGSPGQGNWAHIPWIAVFDRFVTDTAQEGFYIVYLFAEDCSCVYLSLNQGVTTIRREYGSEAKRALEVRAADYLARLGQVDESFTTGRLDLCVSDVGGLGAYYEFGSICARRYSRGALPTHNELVADLQMLIGHYDQLTKLHATSTAATVEEDDESGCGEEDLSKLRYHKRIERNRFLAKKAKRVHGFKCQACGFDFEQTYGELGREYVEAHHLTPISTLVGKKVALNAKEDFAVLCANCHRMIHRAAACMTVEEFRKRHLHLKE